MNLKQREVQAQEYIYLENWVKEHTNDTMTPSYFLDELTLFNESQIQYIIMAYMIPRIEIEKEIDKEKEKVCVYSITHTRFLFFLFFYFRIQGRSSG